MKTPLMLQWMDGALMSPAGCFLALEFGQQNFGEVSTDVRLGRLTSLFKFLSFVFRIYIYYTYSICVVYITRLWQMKARQHDGLDRVVEKRASVTVFMPGLDLTTKTPKSQTSQTQSETGNDQRCFPSLPFSRRCHSGRFIL